jgi:hypothetical protein
MIERLTIDCHSITAPAGNLLDDRVDSPPARFVDEAESDEGVVDTFV